MKSFRDLFLCLSATAITITRVQAARITFQSEERQTSLIELYTSEGCSSCPPAEAWLSRLKESPGLWRDFVPLAFHVDYWDHLGWRDPWAARSFSDRQRAYAERWHSDGLYTPCFVLNGREWRNWSGQRDGPRPSAGNAGVLRVSSSDTNRWQVNFVPAKTGDGTYQVHAALLAAGLSSDVTEGENRGRRLDHDFVVLTLVDAALTRNSDAVQGDFILPVRQSTRQTSLALAVWVTRAGTLEALQTTGGWLVRPADGR